MAAGCRPPARRARPVSERGAPRSERARSAGRRSRRGTMGVRLRATKAGWLAWLCAAALAGCLESSPDIVTGERPCGANGSCPTGYECDTSTMRCWIEGQVPRPPDASAPDGPLPDAAEPDAPLPDARVDAP